jgi:hypothetical protein
MTNNPKSKNTLLVFLLILSIGFVIGAYYYSQVAPKPIQEKASQPIEEENTPEEQVKTEETTFETGISPTITPSPRPLPHGKRSFIVSLPVNTQGPRIGKGTIDPYDPAINGKQTLTIEVNDTVPVQKVVAILKTDNDTVENELQPVTSQGQMKGNWVGSWTVSDTYLKTYSLSVRAVSSSGTSTAAIIER